MRPEESAQAAGTGGLPAVLHAALTQLAAGYPDVAVCVALSGGVDSVALLHALSVLAREHKGLRLRAVHVDHGLQASSGEWAAHCRALCGRLGVDFEIAAAGLQLAPGASVEAEARRARYAALAARLRAGECLLTAHHADDQLETVLLQLFRGAGVAGLAAMPGRAALGAGLHLRPLLAVGRETLRAHARAAGLDWIEDPMNAELRFDRAYLRQAVLPVVRQRWPAAAVTVGRSAAHLAAAQDLLAALAAADAAGGLDAAGRLSTAVLQALPRDRQRNLLRAWIVSRGLGLPTAARLDSVLDDLLPARRDAQPVVTWPAGEIRRYRGWLHAMQPLGPPPPAGWSRPIAAGRDVELPCGLGRVALEAASAGETGLAASLGPLTVGFRLPGERLRPAGRGDAHTLKNLCQEAGVLPWMRPRLPLLRRDGQLVAAPGLWIAAGATAAGAPAFNLRWRDGPPWR